MNTTAFIPVRPFSTDRPIFVAITGILLCHTMIFYFAGVLQSIGDYLFAITTGAYLATMALTCGYFFYLIIKRNPNPIKAYGTLVKSIYKKPLVSLNAILIIIGVSAVLSAVSLTKSEIPQINPFYLDPWLVRVDEWLHFGVPPWQITHALFATPFATWSVNFVYSSWFFITWVFIVAFVCWPYATLLKQQVIICFCMIWFINGNLVASLLSSVGPCYYHHFYVDEKPYENLMQKLIEQNQTLRNSSEFFTNWALNIQNMLWQNYQSDASELGVGISAMPSLHVSMAVLIAMSAYRFNHKLGIIGWLYAFTIFIGSVHLGWHYAADGYMALILTVFIWFCVKITLAKWSPLSAPIKTHTRN